MVLLQNMAFFSLISLASSPIRPLAMHHWCGGYRIGLQKWQVLLVRRMIDLRTLTLDWTMWVIEKRVY
jgi:hypothetical protein